MARQTSLYYSHNDHLGTPLALTNQAGQVVWSVNYTPFGEAQPGITTIANNLRFPGQYFDEETGLHYNYFRDYDPNTGRYIQSDPIGITHDFSDPRLQITLKIGGLRLMGNGNFSLNHLYGYVFQNPLSFIDPLGLYCYVQKDTGTRVCSTASEFGYGERYSFNGQNSAFPYSTNNQCVQDCIEREIEQCVSYPTRSRDIRYATVEATICTTAVVMSCTANASDCDKDNKCED